MLKIHFFCILIFAFASRGEVPVEKHNNLFNEHIKVAAVPFSPFIMFYCNGKEIDNTYECLDKDDLTFGGALWDFLKVVKILRNVTFSIVSPPTPTWGICYQVNNCTGMIVIPGAFVCFLMVVVICSVFAIIVFRIVLMSTVQK